jgi:hypothetical protein
VEKMKLIAPVHLIGEERKSGGYTKTNPRSWSDQEIKWCIEKKAEGFSNADIASALCRSEVSVQIKLKRQTKSNDSYNAKFRELKYLANESFLQAAEPKKVLDVYAGNSWWKNKVDVCWTNDKDESFETTYHLDAFDLLCGLYVKSETFDVIDLDPFGSAYECFDFAFRMAKKGVVISFGEWGHKRWKRTDFVGPRYGIQSLEDFSHELFIIEAQRIARLHKKTANVFDVLQYSNFLRVYFTLTDYKEVSQWEK